MTNELYWKQSNYRKITIKYQNLDDMRNLCPGKKYFKQTIMR
jgi:hypothetical protein